MDASPQQYVFGYEWSKIVGNKIMGINILKKCCWHELTDLGFRIKFQNVDENRVQEGFELSKLHAKKQNGLYCEYDETQYEQCSSITWIAKLESKELF